MLLEQVHSRDLKFLYCVFKLTFVKGYGKNSRIRLWI